MLQNRFYVDSGYDLELRQFCREQGITYQTFWTLTANPHVLVTRLEFKSGRGLNPFDLAPLISAARKVKFPDDSSSEPQVLRAPTALTRSIDNLHRLDKRVRQLEGKKRSAKKVKKACQEDHEGSGRTLRWGFGFVSPYFKTHNRLERS